MLLILSNEEEEGQPGEALSQEYSTGSEGKKRLFSLSIPLVKTRDDLTAVSPEGWDEGAQFRAGQEYPT